MAGSAIVRKLRNEGYDNFILQTSADLDLPKQGEVAAFFNETKPRYFFLAAAKVVSRPKRESLAVLIIVARFEMKVLLVNQNGWEDKKVLRNKIET